MRNSGQLLSDDLKIYKKILVDKKILKISNNIKIKKIEKN